LKLKTFWINSKKLLSPEEILKQSTILFKKTALSRSKGVEINNNFFFFA